MRHAEIGRRRERERERERGREYYAIFQWLHLRVQI